MDDLVKRAFAAWFRSGGTDQPSSAAGGIEEHNGKEYVVLRNVRGVMKVYRVRPDGMLKPIHPPAGILVWSLIAKRAVRTTFIVFDTPAFQDHARLVQIAEEFAV